MHDTDPDQTRRYDLSKTLNELRSRPEYRRGDPSGRTLLKIPDLRVVVIAIKAGGRMAGHSSSGPIALHVLGGKVGVDLGGHQEDIEENQLLTLEPETQHAIEALEDSALLLTIGHTRYEIEPSTA